LTDPKKRPKEEKMPAGKNKSVKARKTGANPGNNNELQTIIDAVPALIFYKDTRNRFLKVNRAYCDIMGMPKEKIEGVSLYKLYPRAEADSYWKDDQIVLSTGKPKMNIYESLHTKNGVLWLRTDKIPYLDDKGRIVGIIGFAVDITAQKNSEREMGKLNRMLMAISESNKALTQSKDLRDYLNRVCSIIIKDCGYKLAWIGLKENDKNKQVNPVAQAGFEAGYLKTLDITWADTERGRGPTGRAAREGRVQICRNMLFDPVFKPWRNEALKRGYASSIAIPLKTDGETFGVLTLYSHEPDPFSRDEIMLLGELGFDVSYGVTLIRAREKNMEAEGEIKKVATFPELDPNPICEIDAAGVLGYANPSFKKLFPDAFETPHDHPWFRDINAFFWALKGVKQQVLTRDVQVKDRYFFQTLYYIPAETKLRIYGVDITKRKTAEDELKTLYADMGKKVELRTAELVASKHLADIGTLAASVAHELRNPLGVINAAAYNLRRKITDVNILKHVESVEKKAMESSQIIDNLLVYARMKMPDFKKTLLHSLLAENIKTAKRNFRGRNVKIHGALNPVKDIFIEADALQLSEIFSNIISNACQAIEGKSGVVEVKARAGNGLAVISVKDNGVGIEPGDLQNIFKPFFTNKTKGTGLGLALCREMVGMHGGTIAVDSAPDKGSTFTVSLPLRRVSK
jgi:PAS domain S-box-containing protein